MIGKAYQGRTTAPDKYGKVFAFPLSRAAIYSPVLK